MPRLCFWFAYFHNYIELLQQIMADKYYFFGYIAYTEPTTKVAFFKLQNFLLWFKRGAQCEKIVISHPFNRTKAKNEASSEYQMIFKEQLEFSALP